MTISLLYQIHLTVLCLIMVWRQSRDRQALSVSEGEHRLCSLSPASLFQDVSTFTHFVTSGYCVLCSLGFVFGFSRQKETRISMWADTKDRLVNP